MTGLFQVQTAVRRPQKKYTASGLVRRGAGL